MPAWLAVRKDAKQMKTFGAMSTVGIELGVSIAVGVLGGKWLDAHFGTAPYLLWVGFALGLAAGARSLYRVARAAQRSMSPSESSS
ncbi:MAG: AtpZ/AtpI family protein [Myxococcales bacterium]|nr:AtpZ/AtpI family protein [Myxococcales bacterium]